MTTTYAEVTTGMRAFVALLDEEAPPETFEDQLQRARERGCDAAELRRLDAEVAVSLRVRAKLARLRRREAELRELHETAADLASCREVDAVLAAIVRRARTLLGADVGYLSLIDEQRRDAHVRVTDGSAAGRFRDVRLPLGTGLAGLVADTATPYTTSDYLSDRGFVHVEPMDLAVSGGGIRATLGVPLLRGGKAIGSLMTGDRDVRPFTPEDVALAASLAAYAVVALENARLSEAAQQALQQRDAAYAEVRRHAETVEIAADADDRLAEVLLRNGDATGVVAVLADLLDGGVAMLDPFGEVLATAGGPVHVDRALRDAVPLARGRGRAVELPAPGAGRRWLAPAVIGGDHLASLVVQRQHTLSDTDLRILERAAMVTALLLLFRRSVADAEDRVRGELLEDLLTRPVRSPATLRERARRHHADLDADNAVVVARVTDADCARAVSAVVQLAADRHGLAALYAGDVVVMLPALGSQQAGELVAQRLREVCDGTVTAGAAGPVCGPDSLSDAYRDARRCLNALLSLGRQGEVADVAGLGYVQLLLGPQSSDDIDHFVASRLGPLIEHDSRRGTELVKTLVAYFSTGRNLNRARAALHVHVNTVAQRLDRVTALLGPRWKEPQQSLELQIALQLRQLRSAADVTPDAGTWEAFPSRRGRTGA